tara:strand:+ start:1670 stop:3130 length:1461 start_codon:yes stop_codon:yes gene_type:complete
MYAGAKKQAMPAISSTMMASSTLTGVEILDPRTLSTNALEEINTSSLLYSLLRSQLPMGLASHSDICELIKLMPQDLHDEFVTLAGSTDFYLHLLPPGLQISTPAVTEAVATMFSSSCPFYTQFPCPKIVNWARENISNSGSTHRRFKIALHEAVDNSAASKFAAAIGIQKTPLASKSLAIQETQEKLQPVQTAASRSKDILDRVSSDTISTLKTIGQFFFFTSLTGDKFVSGELDSRFRGSLATILEKTELNLTDVLLLFGIQTEARGAQVSESVIPQRLWNLGYSLSIHGLLPEHKCSFASLKTLFPSLKFELLVQEHEKYNGTHVYDTILENSKWQSELKWLSLNDLHHSLEIHDHAQLMSVMRDWKDFINLSLAVQPPLSYSVWETEFHYSNQNPEYVFEFPFSTRTEARLEFIKTLTSSPLLWPQDKAEKLARIVLPSNKVPVPVVGGLKHTAKPQEKAPNSDPAFSDMRAAQILRAKMNL